MNVYYTVLLFVNVLQRVIGRARMVEPPMRSSVWREGTVPAPMNYMDELLNCGGFQEQWRNANGKCGACGDPYNEPMKQNEYPGIYSRQEPMRTLYSGGPINITIYTQPNMLGYFEYRLCPEVDSPKLTDLQSCFDKYPLTILETNSTRFYPGSKGGFWDMHALLPYSVSCDRCVFQWKYVTGYRYGWNNNSCGRCLGCGPQETYINCADVRIIGSPSTPRNHGIHSHDHQNHDKQLFPIKIILSQNHSHSSFPAPRRSITTSTTAAATTTTATPTTTTLTSTIKTTTTIRTTTTTKPTTTPTTTSTTTTTTTIRSTTMAPRTSPSTTITTALRHQPCTRFYPNITCIARGLQKFVAGMRSWCSYRCFIGTCPYKYCECFCVYPDGTTVYLENPRRPVTPIVKIDQVSDTCFGPVDAFKDVPGMIPWCQLNCPGFSCSAICEHVDCQ